MKKLLMLSCLLLAGTVKAEESVDLGGIGKFISDLALSANAGTGVDLNTKSIHGLLYVDYPSIVSADRTVEYVVLGVGADLGSGVQGTKLHGSPLVMPLANLAGITSLLTRSNWASQHMAFASIGTLRLGVGILPLPVPGTNGKWVIGNQVIGAASVRFGKH